MASINGWILCPLLCHRRIKSSFCYCSRNALHWTEEWNLASPSPKPSPNAMEKKSSALPKNAEEIPCLSFQHQYFQSSVVARSLTMETAVQWPILHSLGVLKGKKAHVPISKSTVHNKADFSVSEGVSGGVRS